eukprot:g3453.t1
MKIGSKVPPMNPKAASLVRAYKFGGPPEDAVSDKRWAKLCQRPIGDFVAGHGLPRSEDPMPQSGLQTKLQNSKEVSAFNSVVSKRVNVTWGREYENATVAQQNSALELSIIRAILNREGVLEKFRASLRKFNDRKRCRKNPSLLINEHLPKIRKATVQVCQLILEWKQGFIETKTFLFEGENYVIKIPHSLRFVDKIACVRKYLGFALTRNPLGLSETRLQQSEAKKLRAAARAVAAKRRQEQLEFEKKVPLWKRRKTPEEMRKENEMERKRLATIDALAVHELTPEELRLRIIRHAKREEKEKAEEARLKAEAVQEAGASIGKEVDLIEGNIPSPIMRRKKVNIDSHEKERLSEELSEILIVDEELISGKIEDPDRRFCFWCSDDVNLMFCSKCRRRVCKTCIVVNFGGKYYETAKTKSSWRCWICDKAKEKEDREREKLRRIAIQEKMIKREDDIRRIRLMTMERMDPPKEKLQLKTQLEVRGKKKNEKGEEKIQEKNNLNSKSKKKKKKKAKNGRRSHRPEPPLSSTLKNNKGKRSQGQLGGLGAPLRSALKKSKKKKSRTRPDLTPLRSALEKEIASLTKEYERLRIAVADARITRTIQSNESITMKQKEKEREILRSLSHDLRDVLSKIQDARERLVQLIQKDKDIDKRIEMNQMEAQFMKVSKKRNALKRRQRIRKERKEKEIKEVEDKSFAVSHRTQYTFSSTKEGKTTALDLFDDENEEYTTYDENIIDDIETMSRVSRQLSQHGWEMIEIQRCIDEVENHENEDYKEEEEAENIELWRSIETKDIYDDEIEVLNHKHFGNREEAMKEFHQIHKYEYRLLELFTNYNAMEIKNISKYLKAYKGREKALFSSLQKKYVKASKPTQSARPPSPSPSKDIHRQFIRSLQIAVKRCDSFLAAIEKQLRHFRLNNVRVSSSNKELKAIWIGLHYILKDIRPFVEDVATVIANTTTFSTITEDNMDKDFRDHLLTHQKNDWEKFLLSAMPFVEEAEKLLEKSKISQHLIDEERKAFLIARDTPIEVATSRAASVSRAASRSATASATKAVALTMTNREELFLKSRIHDDKIEREKKKLKIEQAKAREEERLKREELKKMQEEERMRKHKLKKERAQRALQKHLNEKRRLASLRGPLPNLVYVPKPVEKIIPKQIGKTGAVNVSTVKKKKELDATKLFVVNDPTTSTPQSKIGKMVLPQLSKEQINAAVVPTLIDPTAIAKTSRKKIQSKTKSKNEISTAQKSVSNILSEAEQMKMGEELKEMLSMNNSHKNESESEWLERRRLTDDDLRQALLKSGINLSDWNKSDGIDAKESIEKKIERDLNSAEIAFVNGLVLSGISVNLLSKDQIEMMLSTVSTNKKDDDSSRSRIMMEEEDDNSNKSNSARDLLEKKKQKEKLRKEREKREIWRKDNVEKSIKVGERSEMVLIQGENDA